MFNQNFIINFIIIFRHFINVRVIAKVHRPLPLNPPYMHLDISETSQPITSPSPPLKYNIRKYVMYTMERQGRWAAVWPRKCCHLCQVYKYGDMISWVSSGTRTLTRQKVCRISLTMSIYFLEITENYMLI